ncbi:MAG: carboxylesterase [Rhodocyclaceae bacterium]|nr:carboxylesterase [Rhodocyclaceae bacterium]MBP6110258.1 carboxylesterase [Rhodocyclaceae bacterium]MBP6279612.1 carboxylesterase [Rhodocyclaceae bacterium]
MTQPDPSIELVTTPNPTHTVIWLHGLGADGNDFVSVVPELGLSPNAAVRFIFPHAPMIPVTCNNGYVMRAWYDILSLGGGQRDVDEAGIRSSRDIVRALIKTENARGIPCEKIILAGFSQGGAMAYCAGLTHPEKLAGIVALSCYLPSPALIEAERTAANRDTPIFAAHGSYDDVVPLRLGTDAKDFLLRSEYKVDWHTYPMPHSVCIEEIIAIGSWLNRRISMVV